MNQITIPGGMPPISQSLGQCATALGAAADAIFQITNSVTDPKTGTGPTKAQTDYANNLNLTVAQLQKDAAAYLAQGC